MPNLTGKVAIVTGSTKGIGLAIAERLINEGASVTVSARSADDVAEVASRLGENALGIPCDVSDPDACARLVEETVEHFGRLDVLVNNAGLGIFKSISEGIRNMPAYSSQISTEDRWAIVLYLKAMWRHRAASAEDVPEAFKDKIQIK